MTDKLRAAAEAAIGAMVRAAITGHADALDGYAEALRAALAEPETESVYAFRRKGVSDDFVTCSKARHDELSSKPRLFETAIFYTAPPRREWVSLTEAEMYAAYESAPARWDRHIRGLRAIEAALKEKNRD